jgi:hypothetical protein
MYCAFLSLNDWDYFYVGKFPGNKSFRIEIASLSLCVEMHNFSVIVKKLLKALATSAGSLIFHHSQVKWKPVPLNVFSLPLSL